MEHEKKRYIQMENILNKINQKCISLPISDVKRNNKILEQNERGKVEGCSEEIRATDIGQSEGTATATHPTDEAKRKRVQSGYYVLDDTKFQITDSLTSKIKEKSMLFKNMFERKFYGGSFYDGIKVGKPEEFDLDYVLNLPLLIEPEVEVSDKDGFVHVRIKEYMKLAKHKETRYDKLDTLMVDDYLSTYKVLQWMEKTINLGLNEFPKTPDGYCFDVVMSKEETVKFYVTVSKSHPAFTLKIKNIDGSISLDIDLVPCFQFTQEQWPGGQYRKILQTGYFRISFQIPTHLQKNKFLVVPKKPYQVENDENVEKYWRLSFQEQERVLIKGNDLQAFKPSIKLIKQLRDKHNHKIASYFIKTVFLWEVHNTQNSELWGQPFSYVFMTMLRRYAESIKNKRIPYYWNENFNLIGHIKEVTLIDISNTLKNIIDQVEQKIDDPFTIAKYLVLPDAIEELRGEVQLGKKFLKKQQSVASSDMSSMSVDYIDIPSACSEENEENKRVTSLDDIFRMQTQLLDVMNDLDRKTDNIYNMVTKLVTMNDKLLKKCSDLEEHAEDLEYKIDDLKKKQNKNYKRSLCNCLFGIDSA